MVQVGEASHKVQPENGKDIIDADAGFQVRFCTQCIGGGKHFGQREFHLIGIEIGVVLVAQAAIEDLGADDLSQPQSFYAGHFIQEKSIEEMVGIDARIVVTRELSDTHQVIGAQTIKIGSIAGGNDQQREREDAPEITCVQVHICEPQWRDITTFVYVQVQ